MFIGVKILRHLLVLLFNFACILNFAFLLHLFWSKFFVWMFILKQVLNFSLESSKSREKYLSCNGKFYILSDTRAKLTFCKERWFRLSSAIGSVLFFWRKNNLRKVWWGVSAAWILSGEADECLLKCDRRDSLGDYWRGLGLGLAAVAVAGSPSAPPAPPPRCPSSSPALPPSPRLMSRSSPAPGGLSPNEWKRLLATGWHSARSPACPPPAPRGRRLVSERAGGARAPLFLSFRSL